jgi:chemotaxis protein methyltransferase CheR
MQMTMWEIGEEEFEFFRGVVHSESGIKLTDMKKALVQARLTKRIRELKLGGFRDYYEYMKSNYSSELTNLINCITTNKTDFFREHKHFDYMRNAVLPEFEMAGKKKLRIWSAGCSTGEEAYSIAITLLEHYKNSMPDIRILASDIDTQVLDKAEAGVYRAETLSDVDISILKKYFCRGRGENKNLFKVKDSAKSLIRFRWINLLDAAYPMKNKFDMIFCRNVIIYFDRDFQQKLFERLHSYLSDDGYLFMGHSETLTGLSSKFTSAGNSIYRKAKQCMQGTA